MTIQTSSAVSLPKWLLLYFGIRDRGVTLPTSQVSAMFLAGFANIAVRQRNSNHPRLWQAGIAYTGVNCQRSTYA